MKSKKFAYQVRFLGVIFVSLAEKIPLLNNASHFYAKWTHFDIIFWPDFTGFKQSLEILSADNSNQNIFLR